jgi:1,2-diacylglycerol 3-alpha-glucosyltransferase
MTHVLYITPGFPNGYSDTKCIPVLQMLCKAMLLESEITISIIALDHPFQEKDYVWNGIHVYSCGGANAKWPYKLFNLIKAAKKIKRINRIKKIDLVHSFWLQDTALLGSYVKRKYKIPHIVTLMGQDVLLSNQYLRLLKNSNASFISLSKFQNEIFKKNTSLNTSIIPWGVDVNEFSVFNEKEREYDIIGIGWLSKVKKLDHFLQVINHLKEKKPNARVLIIGSGEEELSLRKYAKELHLQDMVTFIGLLEREEVLKYMTKSKILLHTSSYESFGYVFIEALASGMKVVSYPVGIAADCSIIHSGKTIDELSDKINLLLSDPFVAEKKIYYDIQETCAKYVNLYQTLK